MQADGGAVRVQARGQLAFCNGRRKALLQPLQTHWDWRR